METYDLDSVTNWLDQSQQPMVISHRRPDGDALGSMAALTAALRQRGRNPIAMLYEPFPPKFSYLDTGAFEWCTWEKSREIAQDACDGVIIVDTCALAQLEPVAEYLARAPRTLVLDHHATRDPVGTRDGDLRYFDETASAAALIVAEWIAAAGVAVDAHIADALFTGIATDTGWFRFSNTDERTLRLAADLVAAGANPNRIHETLYQQDPPAKLRLVARVLSNLELHADGRLAVMKLRAADFEATGADDTMTEDLVNEAARLNNTEVTMLLTEEPEGQVRANFRSKREIDVSELARRYGGGGHVRAAGARLRGSWDSVVSRLIEETVAML